MYRLQVELGRLSLPQIIYALLIEILEQFLYQRSPNFRNALQSKFLDQTRRIAYSSIYSSPIDQEMSSKCKCDIFPTNHNEGVHFLLFLTL